MLTVPRFKSAAVVAVSLLAALAIVTSSASAEETGPKVTLLTEAGPLEKGDPLVAVSANLVWQNSAGNIECANETLSGTVKTNSKEKIENEIASFVWHGNEPGGLCKTTTALGPAEIEWTNVPWKFKLTNVGVAQLTTGIGTKTIRVVFTYPFAGGAKCMYTSNKVLMSFPLSETPVPLSLTMNAQVFKLETGSTAGCVTEAKLGGTFSTTSEGKAVDVETHT
jgi:hypothetical protein